MLNKNQYVIIDPIHLELADEFYDKYDDSKLSSAGEFVTIENEPCFIFPTAFGSGRFKVIAEQNIIGEVDCDSGVLIIMPISLVMALNNPYTLYIASSVATGINLGESTSPTVSNGDCQIGAILIFTSNPDQPGYEMIMEARRDDPTLRLKKKVTSYFAFKEHFVQSRKK
jgi:hypothetical protein